MDARHDMIIALLIASIGNQFADITVENDYRRSSLTTECVFRLLRTYLNMTPKLSVKLSAKQQDDWSDLLRRLDIPMIINVDEIPKIQGLDTRAPSTVILIADEYYNVSERLNRMLWTVDSLFIIVMHDSFHVQEKIRSVFNKFFTNNIVHVLVLVENETAVEMHTFIPFTNCRGLVDDFRALGVCSTGKLEDLKIKKIIHGPGVRNLNGCTVNVTIVDVPPSIVFPDEKSKNGTFVVDGTEGKLLLEISKKMNFKPWFALAQDGEAWGWIEPAPRGVLGEVFTGYSLFGLGSLAPTMERFEYLDLSISTSPGMKCITWAVPTGAGKRNPTWMYILVNEFPGVVWSCILLTILTTAVIVRILVTFSSSEIELFKGQARVLFFYMLSSGLGVPVKIPKLSSVRTLFAAWIWAWFILVTAYQASMGSKLTVPPENPEINTFKDLINSDLYLTGLYDTFKAIRHDEQIGNVKILAKRLEVADYGALQAVRRIATDRNLAYIQDAATFVYHSMLTPNAKGKVHVMNQCVLKYYPSVIMKKKSPYTQRVNEIIRRLFETGVLAHWQSEYQYDNPATQPNIVKLSLKHMTGPFFVLCVGYLLSTVIFLGELMSDRFKPK